MMPVLLPTGAAGAPGLFFWIWITGSLLPVVGLFGLLTPTGFTGSTG